MPETPAKSLRPFDHGEMLSSSDLKGLRDWLEANCQQSIQLTVDYTIADLVIDLDKIADGIWSDGIDAMGEDA